jgi:hypothetical protein
MNLKCPIKAMLHKVFKTLKKAFYTEGVHQTHPAFKVYLSITSFRTSQNPVGMANFVAMDFNPRLSIKLFCLNPVGMEHINDA